MYSFYIFGRFGSGLFVYFSLGFFSPLKCQCSIKFKRGIRM